MDQGPYTIEPRLLRFRRRLALAMRARERMSTYALAGACGASRSTISMYLKGVRLPNAVMLMRLSETLGVSPAWLLGCDVAPDGTPRRGRVHFRDRVETDLPEGEDVDGGEDGR